MSAAKLGKSAASGASRIPNSISVNSAGLIRLQILAKPGAKQNSVTHVNDDDIGVQIAAPPRDGAANEELVEYMSDVLGVKKRQVSLQTGAASRTKSILVSSSDMSVEDVLKKLQAVCSGS